MAAFHWVWQIKDTVGHGLCLLTGTGWNAAKAKVICATSFSCFDKA